jgi:hypothetical protein
MRATRVAEQVVLLALVLVLLATWSDRESPLEFSLLLGGLFLALRAVRVRTTMRMGLLAAASLCGMAAVWLLLAR